MMLLVNDIAVKENLAPQLLVKRETLVNALREPLSSRDALRDALGLSGWRSDLLVAPLWSLLDGQLAVRCQRQDHGAIHLRFLE
jgi:ribonuclease D